MINRNSFTVGLDGFQLATPNPERLYLFGSPFNLYLVATLVFRESNVRFPSSYAQ